MNFLPVSRDEAERSGIKQFDVIVITADAYIDHPSFGAALVGRYLEALGLSIGIIARPDCKKPEDFSRLGRPKYFFGITAGNLDSMVSLYTAQRKIRSQDDYSPGGIPGKRPYLPAIVYTGIIKRIFPGVPVLLGGIEASLRRISHYDFYQDKIRNSILLDSKADLLIYGNAEKPLKEIITRLRKGERLRDLKDVRGTVCPLRKEEIPFFTGEFKNPTINGVIEVPPFEKVKEDKTAFLEMTKIVFNELNPYCARVLLQKSDTRAILINPPQEPLSEKELDEIYDLKFMRAPHPDYKKPIPAFLMIKDSITSHRGCYGGCNFCALGLHQGKIIQSRSEESIITEAEIISSGFSKKGGYITDIGGPTANMYMTGCKDREKMEVCRRKSCLYPASCPNLNISSGKYLGLLNKVRKLKNIKGVFINSGIRTDLAVKNKDFISELAGNYVSGQVSVAPEHTEKSVLYTMCKPSIESYELFSRLFYEESKKKNKEQYIIPYFIIGHPGADEETEKKLALYIKKNRIRIRQLQEFYPTPMTLSTAIYLTGMNPLTGAKVSSEKKLGIKKKWKEEILR